MVKPVGWLLSCTPQLLAVPISFTSSSYLDVHSCGLLASKWSLPLCSSKDLVFCKHSSLTVTPMQSHSITSISLRGKSGSVYWNNPTTFLSKWGRDTSVWPQVSHFSLTFQRAGSTGLKGGPWHIGTKATLYLFSDWTLRPHSVVRSL